MERLTDKFKCKYNTGKIVNAHNASKQQVIDKLSEYEDTKYFHNAKNVEIIIKDIDYFNAKQELNRLNRINNTNCYKVAHTVEVQEIIDRGQQLEIEV